MDGTSWNTGRRISPASEPSAWDPDDMEFWKTVLTDSRFRSRVIRDLEMQSIGSRSLGDLVRSSRDEELLGRGAVRELRRR